MQPVKSLRSSVPTTVATRDGSVAAAVQQGRRSMCPSGCRLSMHSDGASCVRLPVERRPKPQGATPRVWCSAMSVKRASHLQRRKVHVPVRSYSFSDIARALSEPTVQFSDSAKKGTQGWSATRPSPVAMALTTSVHITKPAYCLTLFIIAAGCDTQCADGPLTLSLSLRVRRTPPQGR